MSTVYKPTSPKKTSSKKSTSKAKKPSSLAKAKTFSYKNGKKAAVITAAAAASLAASVLAAKSYKTGKNLQKETMAKEIDARHKTMMEKLKSLMKASK